MNYEAKSQLQEKKNCAFFAQESHFYAPKFDQWSYFVATQQSKNKIFSAFAAPKFGE